MKKIDFYWVALSAILISLAIVAYFKNGDFIFYALMAVLFIPFCIKELISKRLFNTIRIAASVLMVLYLILFIVLDI
ncbi:hypothetical protein [uncultured Sunxiuqinia sp.]|uniref:hypothetical protein n=1 Tax=uncultured Sunxiuqinia sp. TaxID=1573825 RepID=UPI002AA7681A|nr:hypothetical protein [uncultured Sunxiuqinia sp.]